MTKTTQPIVTLERNRGATVDISNTRKNVIALLKENNVKAVDGDSYPVSVSEVNGGYYSNTLQYRVYFRVDFKSVNFVQSDKNGQIDITKLVTKATEYFQEEQNNIDRRNNKEIADNRRVELAASLSEQLKGTGFVVLHSRWGVFQIVKDVTEENVMEEVRKLIIV